MPHTHTVIAAVAALCSAPLSLAQTGQLTPPAGPIMETPGGLDTRLPVDSVNAPGDADSLFRLSESGSWLIPEDIVLEDSGKAGIEIAASNIRLDCNGHNVQFRPPGGTGTSLYGIGVDSTAGPLNSIDIVNCHVDGFTSDGFSFATASDLGIHMSRATNNGGDGVDMGERALVSSHWSFDNGGRGLAVGDNSMVNNHMSTGNGSDGVSAGAGSTLTNVVSNDNQGAGMFLGPGNVGNNLTANGNASSVGIFIDSGSTMSGVVANGNKFDGIVIFDSSLTNATANGNGTFGAGVGSGIVGAGVHITNATAQGNSDAGVRTFGTSTISDSDIANNQGPGMFVDDGVTIRNTMITNNGASGVTAFGPITLENSQVIGNDANGVEVFPSIAGAKGGAILNNQISGHDATPTSAGVLLDTMAEHVRIADNNFDSNSVGVQAEGSNNFIVGNTFTWNGSAIVGSGSNVVGAVMSVAPNAGATVGAMESSWSNIEIRSTP